MHSCARRHQRKGYLRHDLRFTSGTVNAGAVIVKQRIDFTIDGIGRLGVTIASPATQRLDLQRQPNLGALKVFELVVVLSDGIDLGSAGGNC
jgi:hypothetical protein